MRPHKGSGNVRGSNCKIFADAGEIFSGAKIVPQGGTVVYDSVGIAIMDVAAAHLVYDLWSAATHWPRNIGRLPTIGIGEFRPVVGG